MSDRWGLSSLGRSVFVGLVRCVLQGLLRNPGHNVQESPYQCNPRLSGLAVGVEPLIVALCLVVLDHLAIEVPIKGIAEVTQDSGSRQQHISANLDARVHALDAKPPPSRSHIEIQNLCLQFVVEGQEDICSALPQSETS